MFATIRRYQTVSPAKITPLINDGLIPLISEIKGFEGYYCLDLGDGMMSSVTLFDTREAAEQCNQMVVEWGLKNTESLLTKKFEPFIGEVVAQKQPAHALT
ncbi:hypothetical protein [Pedosphaera parvula]|uniref:ABM domain-containing protein n=1 Tax=Pedosphaera parvula (strain Ellin514) TaxID=320771 RepID=B9XDB4_PEDPL|nr:hypothetical protein [Pedosphaera parvula]EEF62060.1 conserved hypothetical protein [Pedosphaera parvula Ellin514]